MAEIQWSNGTEGQAAEGDACKKGSRVRVRSVPTPPLICPLPLDTFRKYKVYWQGNTVIHMFSSAENSLMKV